MKKVLTVLGCACLAASLIALFSVMGQVEALREGRSSAERKRESLQTLYDDAKDRLEDLAAREEALTEENEALRQENEGLNRSLQSAQAEAQTRAASEQAALDALAQSQAAWERQARVFSEEKDAAASRLTEALAVLKPESVQEEPADDSEMENLFAESEDGREKDDYAAHQNAPLSFLPHRTDRQITRDSIR